MVLLPAGRWWCRWCCGVGLGGGGGVLRAVGEEDGRPFVDVENHKVVERKRTRINYEIGKKEGKIGKYFDLLLLLLFYELIF